MSGINIKRKLEYLIEVYEGMAHLSAEGAAEARALKSIGLAAHQRGCTSVCRMVVKDLQQLLDCLEDRHD